MARKRRSTDSALVALREFGLDYPEAHLKSPWPGHEDLAVRDKTFCYLGVEGEPFSISCKLPHSNNAALALPGTKPTAYGLGKSGWVTAEFPDGNVPIEMLMEWIDESYRAQAPKRLVAQLDGAPAPKKKPARTRAKNEPAKKKPARRQTRR
jgi:predicted DNA-binding protein (MmcQ/YjbR family)